jgi:hypothetical protein
VTVDSIDIFLMLGLSGLEALLIAVLVWKRVYRSLPFFFCWILYSLLSTAAMSLALGSSRDEYIRYVVAQLALDAAIQFAVVIESFDDALRFNRSTPPSGSMAVVSVSLTSMVLWALVHGSAPQYTTVWELIYLNLRQVLSVLWVAVFLTLASMSRLKRLRWPERELRIVSGMGFVALVSFAVMILHTHRIALPFWHRLDQAMVASYFGVMAYWLLIFL